MLLTGNFFFLIKKNRIFFFFNFKQITFTLFPTGGTESFTDKTRNNGKSVQVWKQRPPGFCRKVYIEKWPMLYVCHFSQHIADLVPLTPKLACLSPKKRDLVSYNHTEQWSKLGSWTWIQCHPISSKARFQNVCLLQRQALPRNMALEWSRLFCPFWTRTVAQSFFIFTWSFSSFNLDILGRVQAICFVDGYLIWVCLMFPRD